MDVLAVIARVLKLIELYKGILDQLSALKIENADLKQKLADEMTQDKADADKAAAAQADADAAKKALADYQASVAQQVADAKSVTDHIQAVADALPADFVVDAPAQ